MIKVMHHHRPSPRRFTRHAFPVHRVTAAPPVPHVCGPDVIGYRHPVRVNFHTATNMRHIESIIRIAQPVRVNNLHHRGVTPATGRNSVRSPVDDRQRIAVNHLVTECQPEKLRQGLSAFKVAVTPGITGPVAPVRLHTAPVLICPVRIKCPVAAHLRQHPVVRLHSGAKNHPHGIVQQAGDTAVRPAVIADKVAYSGNHTVAPDVHLIVR